MNYGFYAMLYRAGGSINLPPQSPSCLGLKSASDHDCMVMLHMCHFPCSGLANSLGAMGDRQRLL